MISQRNKAKFGAAMKAAVLKSVAQQVLPVFKQQIFNIARFLIVPSSSYAGTPQWSGNATANWYLTRGKAQASYVQYYPDVDQPYSAKEDPNVEAMDQSLRRIRGALAQVGIQHTRLALQNPTPYLRQYDPYGGYDLFRITNSPVATVDLAASRLKYEFSSIDRSKAARARAEWGV